MGSVTVPVTPDDPKQEPRGCPAVDPGQATTTGQAVDRPPHLLPIDDADGCAVVTVCVRVVVTGTVTV